MAYFPGPGVFFYFLPSLSCSLSSPEAFSLSFPPCLSLDGLVLPTIKLLYPPTIWIQTPLKPLRPARWQPKPQRGSTCMARCRLATETTFKRQSTTIFDDEPWCRHVKHNFFFKLVPFISDESARIVAINLRAIRKFTSGSEPNKVLFWCNIWSCFQKSHFFFKDKLWKLPVKVCLVLCAGPTGTWN